MCIGEHDLYPDLQNHESKHPKYAEGRLDLGFSNHKQENNLKFRDKG